MKTTRRNVIAGLTAGASHLAIKSSLAGKFSFHRGGASSISAHSGLPTSRVFRNTSASFVGAGWFTNFFMMAFRKGDLPAGHWPAIQINGVTQDISLGTANQCSYWADGSLMLCPAFFRGGVSLAPSGRAGSSVTVSIIDGGGRHPTSTLTASDVRAQLLQVNVTGISIASNASNLQGNYTAQFFNTNLDQLEEHRLFEGPAGVVYRNMADFVPANGSFVPTSATKHGRVVAYGYIKLLQNSNGTIAGGRFLPRITQPYYADTLPVGSENPTKKQAAFSVCQWQWGSGPTVIDFPFPFKARLVTPTLSSNGFNDVYTASSSHGYFTGSLGTGTSADWTMLGCTLTGANLPITANDFHGSHSLNTTTLYYVGASSGSLKTPSSQLTLSLYSNGSVWFGGVGSILRAANTNSFTVNPCLVCNTFGSIFGASSTKATWNFFRGTGNLTADSAITSLFDAHGKAYLKSTGLIPPFDFTASGFTSDTDSTPFSPFSLGPSEQGQELGGDHDILGPWNGWATKYLGTQSSGGELMTRKFAYAGAHQSQNLRDSTTRTIINVAEANGETSYVGMPASLGATFFWAGGGSNDSVAGFTKPPTGDRIFCYDQCLGSHHPGFCYPAYLIWGEPQWLDLQLELANQAIFAIAQQDRNQRFPTQVYAVVTRWNASELRASAWPYRDVVQAAIIAPGKRDGSLLAPDGSAVSKYFHHVTTVSSADFVTMTKALGAMDGTGYTAATGNWMVSTWQTNALTPDGVTQAGTTASWQRAYIVTGMCLAATGCENAAALAAIQQEQQRLTHIYGLHNSGYQLADYEAKNGLTSGGVFKLPINSDDFVGQTLPATVHTWTNSGERRFSVTFPGGGVSNVPLANDDNLIFDSNSAMPAAPATSPTRLFVLDNAVYGIRDLLKVGGTSYEFNLYNIKDGTKTVIYPTDTGNYAAYWHIKHPPAPNDPNGPWPNYDPTPGTVVWGCVRYLRAALAFNGASDGGLVAVDSDLSARVTVAPVPWPGAPATPARWQYTSRFS